MAGVFTKRIIQGKVEGTKKCGRPRRIWTDDLKDWSACDTNSVTKLATEMNGSSASSHGCTDGHWCYALD